jgi:hypothetical protein
MLALVVVVVGKRQNVVLCGDGDGDGDGGKAEWNPAVGLRFGDVSFVAQPATGGFAGGQKLEGEGRRGEGGK